MVDFIEPITHKDISTCISLIADLKKSLPNEAQAWEQPLLSIIKGIENNYDHDILLVILGELPKEITIAFFLRILPLTAIALPCLKALVSHINSLPAQPSIHATILIHLLLRSPLPISELPEAQGLLLKLNVQEQSILFAELQKQIKRYAPENNNTQSAIQKENHHNYDTNYKKFLSFLALQTITKPDLKTALGNDPYLANLLIRQLLELSLEKHKQHELAMHLLHEGALYPWSDPDFREKAHVMIVAFLASLPPEKLVEHYKIYCTAPHHHANVHRIKLLDRLYTTTQNIASIMDCLDATGQSEQTAAIDFLTLTQTRDQALRQACLKKIDIKQLPAFCGHMMAIDQIGNYANKEFFIDYIMVLCGHLKTHASPRELLEQLVFNIKVLPPSEEHLAIQTIINQLTTQEHKGLWLELLTKEYSNKITLLPYWITFIKDNPEKNHLIIPIINNLSPNELLALYEQMQTEQLGKSAFHCFKVLFKSVEKHPHLFHLLSNTPVINQELLNEFIALLDDKSLIDLIAHLLKHTQDNSEFKTTLNQVLFNFCQRLYDNQKPDTAIHQWSKQPFSDTLVYSLLDNPECIDNLTMTNSLLYSWRTWTNTASALKYRIDAVLNWRDLDQDRLKNIALSWLRYFRERPSQLHTLFSNLTSSDINRTDIGKKNFLGIKHACWELINSGTTYQESAFLNLFFSPKTGLLDTVLSPLVEEKHLFQEPQHSALWQKKTPDIIPSTMDDESLITLLVNSVHENTLSNWKKIALWLDAHELDKQQRFINKLIENVCSRTNNPILHLQAHQLITQCKLFDKIFPQLEETHCQWLIQHATTEQLNQKVLDWLDLIIDKPIQLGKIIALLPPRKHLFELLLKKPALDSPEIIAQLFMEFYPKIDCTIALDCLHQFIRSHKQAWIDQFLKIITPQIKTIAPSIAALRIVNSLIIEGISAHPSPNTKDKELVRDHLKTLHHFMQPAQQYKHTTELKPLILFLLNAIAKQGTDWNEYLLMDPTFGEIILNWLHSADFKNQPESINMHPLTHLFIETPSPNANPELKNNPLFQEFIHLLLSNPPPMSSKQFNLLFNWLTSANQTSLAQHLLSKPQHTELHLNTLHLLINALDPKALFTLFEKHNNSPLIAHGVLIHSKGLNDLSLKQQIRLFDKITTANELLALLDNQIPLKIRVDLIKALFKIYGHNATTLSQKFAQWGITSETLAAIANFTIETEHQRLLHEVLQEKAYYQDFLNDYLHHPTLNMVLNKNSYLYHSVRTNLLSNRGKKSCHSQFIKQLPTSEILIAVKNRYGIVQNIQALSTLFYPLSTVKHNATTLLQAARWHHQLSLIHGGLLEALRFYKDKSTAIATIEIMKQTELYRYFLSPLLTGLFKKEQGSPSLFSALKKYSDAIAHCDGSHHKIIQETLNNYSNQLKTMQDCTVPSVYEYFRPDSSILPHNAKEGDQLTTDEAQQLVKSHSLHKEWLDKYGFAPEHYFAEALHVALKEEHIIQNEEFNHWMFEEALFTPVSSALDETILKEYLAQTPLSQLPILIHQFFEKIQLCVTSKELLPDLKPAAFLKQLLTYDPQILNQLVTTTGMLNLVFLKNMVCLAVYIKSLRLTEAQTSTLLLSTGVSNNQDIHWLQQDLHLLNERLTQVSTRLNQLTYLGFCYRADSQNDARLLSLMNINLAQIPTQTFIRCINSYAPLFSEPKPNPTQLLRTIEHACTSATTAKIIIEGLDAALIKTIIAAVIDKPEQYSRLLEKLLLSTHVETCQQQLQLKLNSLLQQAIDPQPTSIAQLSAQQIDQLPPQQLHKILTIQRLLFFAKPIDELHPFIIAPDMLETQYERQLFSADVSLFRVIADLKKSGEPMEQSTAWLATLGQQNMKSYATMMEALNAKKLIEYPAVSFNWLSWKAFIHHYFYNNKTMLIDGFLKWLLAINEPYLHAPDNLNHLLESIAEQKQLTNIFISAIANHDKLSPVQIAWLCDTSLKIAPQDAALLPYIIKLNSWSWLEKKMLTNSPQNFNLLKIAVISKGYLADINKTEESQARFLARIENSKFSARQMLELIKTTSDPRVKSLLTLHLLSQKDYLNSLKGNSIIDRLSNNDTHEPSRLNALIHPLDLTVLTKSRLEQLPPETAISLLCSIPHFHLLTEEQVSALLKRYPSSAVIAYWLNHCVSMPNAHLMLAHLMKCAEISIETELSKLDDIKKERITTHLIEHLELFDLSNRLLQETTAENHLILAIRLYLNDHKSEAYVTFIKELTDRLLAKNHHFSIIATQLLLSLNSKANFHDLNTKTAYLMNHDLRNKAQKGAVELFYKATGQLNIPGITQPLILKPQLPKTQKGFIINLLAPISDEEKIASLTDIPEHPLIKILAAQELSVKAFDYFLIHFKGDNKKLFKAISDYLGFYAEAGCTDALRKSMHHTSTLMTRPELDLSIREAVYASFLRYPALYDEQISYCMFLFDAQRTIQHFGLQGGEQNYHQVIDLCDWALAKLDSSRHKDIIRIATRAKAEAQLELTFNEERGFFARLFRRFKRCWICGWTGFFSPNLPIYVVPASSKITNTAVIVEPEESITLPTVAPEKELSVLLAEIKVTMSQQKLTEIIDAAALFSLQAQPTDELSIRYTLHHLFNELMPNKTLEPWLTQNQNAFLMNAIRLLELSLIKGSSAEVASLVQQFTQYPLHIQLIAKELSCTIPELLEKDPVQKKAPSANEPGLLAAASGFVNEALSWSGLGGFFKAEPAKTTPLLNAPSQTPVL